MNSSEYAGFVQKAANPNAKNTDVIILDCKKAEKDGVAIVEDWREEGGRYQVLCDAHGYIVYCETKQSAGFVMRDPTYFCDECRILAGELELSDYDPRRTHRYGVREMFGKKTTWVLFDVSKEQADDYVTRMTVSGSRRVLFTCEITELELERAKNELQETS